MADQTLPMLWLISDARNDAVLPRALARLPRGSGFVFRHYHLSPKARRARFKALAQMAARRGITMAWAGSVREALRVGADAVYGPPRRTPGLASIATVHSFRELGEAHWAGAELVMISPVFPTRSHPGVATLGAVRARLLARAAQVPVVFLGGITAARARQLLPHGWAAIDGLS